MQDGERLRKQVDEMTLRAEIRATVSEDHRDIATKRIVVAEREIQKLRLMMEVFTMGERLLREKKKQIHEGDKNPTETALEGLDAAINNVVSLGVEAKRALNHNEGARMALSAMETTLQENATAATSRARGMAVQGERAIQVAESRNISKKAQEGAQNVEQAPSMLSPTPHAEGPIFSGALVKPSSTP